MLLLVSYVAAMFGPPPPSVSAIIIGDILGTALAVTWGYWIDRRRS